MINIINMNDNRIVLKNVPFQRVIPAILKLRKLRITFPIKLKLSGGKNV